jgi:hypothetical protein
MNKLLTQIDGWVQNGPMGNDLQIEPFTMAAMAVGSAALKGYGNWRANKELTTKPISPGQVQQYMAPVQGQINQMQAGATQMMQAGQGMMDPNSAMNQQYKQDIGQQSQSNLALQALLNRRQAAATGQNSAITDMQNRMQMGQTGRDLTSQYGQAMQGRFQQGLQTMGGATSLLGNVASKQMGIQENITQAAVAQRNAQAQAEMQRNQRAGGVWSSMGDMGQAFLGSSMEMGQQTGGGWKNPYKPD